MAWGTGQLDYRLRETQRRIKSRWLSCAEKWLKFYIECTRRLGKSTFGLIWLCEDCIQHPGSVSAFFAPVKEGLRDYIGPIIRDTLADCPEDLRPILDASLTLNFPNGSKIIFRGSNNQSHRTKRGNAFRRVFIDEGRDVDDLDNLLESVVMPSLFSTDGRVMISSTPADTEDHPLHDIKQAAEREGWYFHADIYDANRHDPADFPPERIEQWKRETLDPVAWDREYMALWVKDPTKIIIPEWDESYEQDIERTEFFQFYTKYAAMDLGVRDKTAAIFGYYDFKRAHLIVEDEFALQDSEVRTDKIAERIKAKERELVYQLYHDRNADGYKRMQQHERTFRRVADNNNPLLIQDLNQLHGLDFFATRKDEMPAMINLVREWVKDGRIYVSPKCKELIGCLRNAVWDKDKRELARSKIYGHFDALMALVYLVRNLDTYTNPIPQYYGKTWATHPGVPIDATSPRNGKDAIVRVLRATASADRDKARSDFARSGNNGLDF